MMNMTTAFTLTGDGDTTSMAWEADVKIAGPVGSMGQRVLQPLINQQVGTRCSPPSTSRCRRRKAWRKAPLTPRSGDPQSRVSAVTSCDMSQTRASEDTQ